METTKTKYYSEDPNKVGAQILNTIRFWVDFGWSNMLD